MVRRFFCLGLLIGSVFSCKPKNSKDLSEVLGSSSLTKEQSLLKNDLLEIDQVPLIPSEKSSIKIEQIPLEEWDIYVKSYKKLTGKVLSHEMVVTTPISNSLAKDFVEKLRFELDGTVSFSIDGYRFVIDPRPIAPFVYAGQKNISEFTDFFAGFQLALAKMDSEVRSGKLQIADRPVLLHLLQAYQMGDFKGTFETKRAKESKNQFIKRTVKYKNVKEARWFIEVELDHSTAVRKYLVAGLIRLMEAKLSLNRGSTKKVLAVSPSCLKKKNLIALSFIPFKFQDSAKGCHDFINQAIEWGFTRVAYFPPAHFAGGIKAPMKTGNVQLPAKPMVDIDYKIISLLAPSVQENVSCIENILNSGLELTYIPHLEALATMISLGESEWRIHAPVPVDDEWFYRLAYAPLVDAVKNAAKTGKLARLTVSLAGEIDNSFMMYPDSSLKLAKRLRTDLMGHVSQINLAFNPNGDISNLECQLRTLHQERGINGCKELRELFTSELDLIGPSMYDEYSHILPNKDKVLIDQAGMSACYSGRLLPGASKNTSSKNGDDESKSSSPLGLNLNSQAMAEVQPSFEGTVKSVMNQWSTVLNRTCPGLGEEMKKHFKSKIGIGEFSLQGPRAHFYRSFLEEALTKDQLEKIQINFWNTRQADFDPFVMADNKPGIDKNAKEILNFLHCR